MIYILKIINPQDEAVTLYFTNKTDIYNIIESIENAGCTCVYQIYTDEYEAIMKKKNDRVLNVKGGDFARLDKDTQTNNRKSHME